MNIKKLFLLSFIIVLLLLIILKLAEDKKEKVISDSDFVGAVKVREEENSATVTLLFVGDIMLSRGVEYVAPRYKEQNFPFQYIEKVTRNADLTIGNLETPITGKGPYMVPYSLIFNSNPKYLKSLQSAGFDILSSANNHALDQGENGLLQTIKYVEDGGMESVGAGEDCHSGLVKDVNGIKFGFLAYSYTGYNSGGHAPSALVCDWNDFEKVKSDVTQMKSKVDHVIILAHTGVEYSKTPTEKDKEKMRELVKLGVSVVVGAHPHVVQEVENYKYGIIAYSLGNFVFDNQENPETEKGLMLHLTFNKKSLQNSEKLPIKIKNYCCPELAEYATLKK